MKLLLLGGTRFLGRCLATAARARDHEVTLFNRGQHVVEELRDVETIQGDRHTDLGRLKDRRWDAVVDTSGLLPRAVKAAAEVLSDAVDRYVFLSTQNVYADVSVPGVDETTALATLTDEELAEANAIDTAGQPSYGKMYGPLKALCEQAAAEAMPESVLTIRPGLIVGPYDYTDRFTYWVVRVARGSEVLAPANPDRFVQFIDVRDLAEWTVRMVEQKQTGIYNANGLPSKITMQDVLTECKMASKSDASFTWVTEDFLLQENVAAWSDMPLWLPEVAAPHLRGFMFINCNKAMAAGLSFRPLRETIDDTLAWFQGNRLNEPLKAGIESSKEEALLSRWHVNHV